MNDQNLEQRIQALEKWKAEREAQQIKFPLDIQSQTILNKYFMRIDDLILYEVVGAAAHPVYLYIGTQGDQSFQLSEQTIFEYSVDPSSDILTVTANNRFVEETAVHLNTSPGGTFPNPLAVNTTYYVKGITKTASGSRFNLSLTAGGAAINITTTGTGPQYIEADT